MTLTRRTFVTWAGLAGAAQFAPARLLAQSNSPFKISVISDEISDDFDHACSVIANDFGLHWVELRGMWKKSLTALSSDELSQAQAILAKYKLQVTDIASPLFKVDWPGAPPRSKSSAPVDAKTALAKQDQVLEKCIELAKQFKTDKIRCFDFWRLDDPAPFRKDMDEALRKAAEKTNAAGLDLVLENEQECNTATAPEAARTLKAVPNINLNWDPGNAAMTGETDVFPVGWNMLPKERIHHCHAKNVVKNDAGKAVWSPVGIGFVDWKAQFAALKAMGYRQAVSLETHWRGAGTPEASSRESWATMKKALADAQAL